MRDVLCGQLSVNVNVNVPLSLSLSLSLSLQRRRIDRSLPCGAQADIALPIKDPSKDDKNNVVRHVVLTVSHRSETMAATLKRSSAAPSW